MKEAVPVVVSALITKWRHAAEHLGLEGLASLSDCADELEAALASTSTKPADEVKVSTSLREKYRGAWSAGYDDRPWNPAEGTDERLAYLGGKNARLSTSSAAVKAGPVARPFGWWHEQEGLCLAEIGSPADLDGWTVLYTTPPAVVKPAGEDKDDIYVSIDGDEVWGVESNLELKDNPFFIRYTPVKENK